MSDYVKSTNFTAKDALTSGDPNKVIKGSEHDTEYDNIASMSSTKANKVSSPVTDNVATLTSGGDLADSGYKFSELSGNITVTAAELNKLDGVTATTAELNKLAGSTAGTVLTTGDEGSGNGIDADTVDSLEGSDLLQVANNLSDLTDKVAARNNIGMSYPAPYLYLGDGSDGSLTVSSSTNLDPGEYHYTDLEVTVGNTLGINVSSGGKGFLIIRVQGTCTIAGAISADSKGANRGSRGASSNGGAGGSGTCGAGGGGGADDGVTYDGGAGGAGQVDGSGLFNVSGGAGGTSAGQSGSAGTAMTSRYQFLLFNRWHNDGISPGLYGAGGGGGAAGNASNDYGGYGGYGGGCIIIIAKEFVFTGTVSADGGDGTNGHSTGGSGGGGGGGAVIMAAQTWTTDTGTVSAAAGAGATAGSNGGAGSAGYTKKLTLA